jgi:hypothetical protein
MFSCKKSLNSEGIKKAGMSERRPVYMLYLNDFDVRFRPEDSIANVTDAALKEIIERRELTDKIPDIAERGALFFRDASYVYAPFDRCELESARFNTEMIRDIASASSLVSSRKILTPSGIFYNGDRLLWRILVNEGDDLISRKPIIIDLREYHVPLAKVMFYPRDGSSCEKPYGPIAKIRVIPASLKWYEFKDGKQVNTVEGAAFKPDDIDGEHLQEMFEEFGWELK